MRKCIIGLFLLLCACGDKPTLRGQEFRIIQNGLEITLGFDAHTDRYYGKAANTYYGTYQIQGNQIHFSSPASTMYFADEESLQTEETFFDTLPNCLNYQLNDTTLTLITDDNQILRFQK